MSTPLVQSAGLPVVLAPAAAPSGSATSTPEYPDTAMATLAEESSVAVTGPSAVATPSPSQTSTVVWFRPPHWARTRVQVSPRPLTSVTVRAGFGEIDAR